MYTRLLYDRVKDNTSEKLAILIEDEIIPSFQKQGGWEGWRLVINQDTKKLALILNWQSKDDAIKVAQSGLIKEHLNKIIPLLATQPNLNFIEPN